MIRPRILLEAAAALLVLWIALVFLHPEVALQGKVYSSSDSQAAAAFQRAGDDALAAGEYPHWNPYVFAGMPSYGSLAYNPGVYPLTKPIKLLREGLGLPPMTWLLVHLLIAAMGMTAWLRWRGEGWAIAIVGGILILALPKLSAWGAYGHGTKVGTFAWMPWALWCTEALLKRGGIGWAAGLATSLALMLLRGHVQVAYYAVLAISVIVLAHWIVELRDPQSRRSVLTRTGWIAAAGLVAFGAALVLYLPVLEYQAHSIRGAAGQGGGAAFDYATGWSLSWPEVATLWWPTALGYGRGAYVGGMPFTDYPNYIGLPLLGLGLIGVLLRRNRMSWALLSIAVLALLVSLGKNFFVYQLLYDLLPGFKKFRVPVMILILQELSVIVLAAQGLRELLIRLAEAPEHRPRWLGRPLLVASLALGVVMVAMGSVGAGALRDTMASRWGELAASVGRPMPPGEAIAMATDIAVSDALRLGAVWIAITLAFLGFSRGRLPKPGVVGLIGLLLFLDLWRVNQPLLHPEDSLLHVGRQGGRLVAVPSPPMVREPAALAEYTADAELTRWLHAQSERPRVMPIGGWEADNRLAARKIVSLGGYHAAKLSIYEAVRARLFDPQRPALGLANMFAAEWVVAARPFSQQTLEAVRSLGLDLAEPPELVTREGAVYRNLSALPRAWMVERFSLESPGSDTTELEPEASVLARVLDQSFDPRSEVILSASPQPHPEPGAAAGSVDLIEEAYNHLKLRVEAPSAGIVVLSEVWYPAWRVFVDGEAAELLRANHALRAVAVGAGTHEIVFEYATASYDTGRRLASLSTLLILLGFAWPLLERWRGRRSTSKEPSA